jgi:pyruvate kinase
MTKKQTKIVATISDRKCDAEFIKKMHDAGVDVIRLNTAHQGTKETLEVIKIIRKVSERIAILIDTKGPEVRISEVPEDLDFQKGDLIRLSGAKSDSVSTDKEIFVNYADFHNDVPTGSAIFIDDGKMELKVRKKNKGYLVCEVMNDGIIKSHKSVNVPGVHLQLEALSKKDKEYIDFSIKHNVDFIAHSFVRSKEDIIAIQKILLKKKSQIKIIAKIENIEGVNNLNEILEHADGVMVARGDLGIEIAPEEIPLIQKNIIRRCMYHRKPVIVATQMLQSMVKNPRPTRAEVSDVANAVIDGADAVMLSEESASGDYPVESVEIMSRIVRRVELSNEKCCSCNLPTMKSRNTPADYLIKAAIQATNELDIKEIIMTAKNDFTAEAIASHRGRIPVYVKCFDKTVVRQLGLIFGVNAHYVQKEENHKKFITNLFKNLVKKGKLTIKDKVVFLGSDLNNGSEANFMEICEVGKYVNENLSVNK